MLNHNNKLLKYIANFSHSKSFSYMNKNIMSILHKYSISHEKLYCNESIKIRDTVACNRKLSIISELLLFRDQLLNINLNYDEIETLLRSLCILFL